MAERYGIEVGHFKPLGPKQPFFLDLTQVEIAENEQEAADE